MTQRRKKEKTFLVLAAAALAAAGLAWTRHQRELAAYDIRDAAASRDSVLGDASLTPPRAAAASTQEASDTWAIVMAPPPTPEPEPVILTASVGGVAFGRPMPMPAPALDRK